MDQTVEALELVRGQNLSLESISGGDEQIVVGVVSEFPSESSARPDVSILLLDNAGKVRTNADFVFYNQREAAGGAVRLVERAPSPNDATGSPGEVLVVDFASLPADVDRIVVGASLDSDAELTFANADQLEISLLVAESLSPSVVFKVAVQEPVLALLFGEFYRRGDEWKFRALGQGYEGGLSALAQEFGVDIDDEQTTTDSSGVVAEIGPIAEEIDEPAASSDLDGLQSVDMEPIADPAPMTIKKVVRPPRLPEWSLRNDLNDEAEWDRARLFSVSAIGSGDERERRAVSALLSVMNGVREFGRELVRRSSGPAGTIETFIEPEFEWNEKKYRPDGLIRVTRGVKQWTALVEAKSSTAKLEDSQVEVYVDIARKLGFDAVITVSNQLLGAHDQHPVTIDKRKLKKVSLHHLSWDEIRSVAIQMSMHRQVQDSTQSWVLREFVRYLQHPKSGLHGFTDMGPQWVQVREAVKTRTLNVDNKGAIEVCNLFDQLVRHIGHDLSCLLSTDVRPIFPRNRPDSTSRIQQLADSGMMFGSLRVPGATGPLTLAVDLRSDTVECSTLVDAPREGRPVTRVNWIVKQMPDAHVDTLVEAVLPGRASANVGALLGQLRESPDALVPADGKLPKQFKITRGHTLSRNRGNVVISANKLVEEFYRNVVQVLRSPKPAKPAKG
ncbi:TerD family protein [Williamsia sp. 1135]|uniref:TerD family protein n=1 Tax=Williamsia sp. 1135 TaxID=1889262 RepID=UPI001F0A8801|nr:TerD family protein [Williamsia sp. 1135]